MDKALVIGANGQVGSELTYALRRKLGDQNVIATDIREPKEPSSGPFLLLDIKNPERLEEILTEHSVTMVFHLAAVLSAKAEEAPSLAWDLNMQGLLNVLEAARRLEIERVFWPSSIAAFGPNTPKIDTPQQTYMDPNTVYGISKLAGERWCEYYNTHHGVDVRSLRYPGLISYKTEPGGGTTDFAVDIYHHAANGKKFACYLSEGTSLPFMYIDDAVRATLELMETPQDNLSVRCGYNIAGFTASPQDMEKSIAKVVPAFEAIYTPDFRQEIADSWPQSIDDTVARSDWAWQPEFDLDAVTDVMLKNVPVNAE